MRAQDIFPAIVWSDLFMKRESAEEDWTLFDPYDVPHLNELYGAEFEKAFIEAEHNQSIRKTTIPARELFTIIMSANFKHGTPFAIYKDTANIKNKNKHKGMIRTSNLCTEIFQNTEPERDMYSMVLADNSEITMSAFETIVTGNGSKKVKYVEVGDTIDGVSVYSILQYRSKGNTAICNLASINLAKMTHLPEDEFFYKVYVAVRMLDNVIDVNLYPSTKIEDTAKATRAIGLGVMGEAEDIAMRHIEFGSQDHVEYIEKYYTMFEEASIAASEQLATEKGAYPEWEGSDWPNPVRNGYINAIAPTSSIALLVGTTSCIEQVFKRKWNERNLSGVIPVTAPHLNPDNYAYYQTAHSVDQGVSIEMNGLRSAHIDQGISFNLFIKPEEITNIGVLAALYRRAWMAGLKSVYYVRSQAPEEKEDDVVDRSLECSGCQ